MLKALCAWREVTARERDIPRNRIVDEKSLLTISRMDITDKSELKAQTTMRRSQIRKYADDILSVAGKAREVPESECPPAIQRPARAPDARTMDRLRKVIDEKAGALNVAPELLATRKHLEQLFGNVDEHGCHRLPKALSGWRRRAIGEDLLKVLNEKEQAGEGSV